MAVVAVTAWAMAEAMEICVAPSQELATRVTSRMMNKIGVANRTASITQPKLLPPHFLAVLNRHTRIALATSISESRTPTRFPSCVAVFTAMAAMPVNTNNERIEYFSFRFPQAGQRLRSPSRNGNHCFNLHAQVRLRVHRFVIWRVLASE